jgi:hypothetical protein
MGLPAGSRGSELLKERAVLRLLALDHEHNRAAVGDQGDELIPYLTSPGVLSRQHSPSAPESRRDLMLDARL